MGLVALDGKGTFGVLAWEKRIGQNLGFSSFFSTPGCGTGGVYPQRETEAQRWKNLGNGNVQKILGN